MSKFNNRKTEVDGITFDSAKEARRYMELRLLEKTGQIKSLETQITYPFIVNKQKICSYRADFRYTEGGKQVIEDVKGVRTSLYRLKKKLMKACYGIEVFET